MAFQLIFTGMVEMGLVERMAEWGCFGDLWDKIISFVHEGADRSYLVSLGEWLDIFVVACLKEAERSCLSISKTKCGACVGGREIRSRLGSCVGCHDPGDKKHQGWQPLPWSSSKCH